MGRLAAPAQRYVPCASGGAESSCEERGESTQLSIPLQAAWPMLDEGMAYLRHPFGTIHKDSTQASHSIHPGTIEAHRELPTSLLGAKLLRLACKRQALNHDDIRLNGDTHSHVMLGGPLGSSPRMELGSFGILR